MFIPHTYSSIALAALLLAPTAVHGQSAQWTQDLQTEGKVQQALAKLRLIGSSNLSTTTNGVVELSGNVVNELKKVLTSGSPAGIRYAKTATNNLIVVPTAQGPTTKPALLVAGTTLPIRLNGEIDTKTAKQGDTFQGTIAANVFSGATVALPIGTSVTGRIVEAKGAGRISGAAELSLELISVQLSGQPVAITTQALSSKVDEHGTNTAACTGGGAALGAVIGGLAGDGTGAGIGAASDGILELGSNVLRPGEQIVLRSEALLQFQTSSNLELPKQHRASSGSTYTPSPPGTHQPNEMIDIPNQSDPATFDILTLKLGMTANEAAAAITTHIPEIDSTYLSPSDALLTPGKKYTNAALYASHRFRALLTFTETYPFDPARPEQLTSINYEAENRTAADRQQFRDSILAKYGTPYRDVEGLSALWCNKGVSFGSDPLACAPNVPNLQLKGNELILSDTGPYQRERALWNQRTIGAPPL